MASNINVNVNDQTWRGVGVIRVTDDDTGQFQNFILPPDGEQTITQNGDYDVTDDATVHVNVDSGGGDPVLQQKSVTAPATGTTNVTPDSGYDGLSRVTVSPTPTETKSITANGTYTPSSGKHFSQVTVNVSGDTPQTQEKTVSPTTSVQEVTPDSGKLLSKVTVNAIQTETKSATPSESAQQINASSGKYMTRVDVGAISSTYIGSGVTRKVAATYTPGTTAQTIAANQYLNGAQTIEGDADLVAGNIKKNVNIFGVTGTYEGSGGEPATITLKFWS